MDFKRNIYDRDKTYRYDPQAALRLPAVMKIRPLRGHAGNIIKTNPHKL